MTPTTGPRLLADIGGTNARFALQDAPGAECRAVDTLATAGFPTLLEAARHYLASQGDPRPVAAAIGIANPVTGDRVTMTNHHWSFSVAETQAALGLARLVVVNDFTALALALPTLAADERRAIGGAAVGSDGAPIALIGPGTGLGVGGLLVDARGRFVPIAGEGGHVTLAAATDHEAAVIAAMRRRFGHVSAERAVSGPGLVHLHRACCELAGEPVATLEPAEVASLGAAGRDPRCAEALDLFFAFLGSCAGDLALTLGARGGVFVGGGIVPKLGDAIDRSAFRARFEAKGRFAAYLRPIPTWLIDTPMPIALRGAAAALDLAD